MYRNFVSSANVGYPPAGIVSDGVYEPDALPLPEEDSHTKERFAARNALEGYCYNLKHTLEDEEEGISDKISEEEKESLEQAIGKALAWLDDNQEAEKGDYDIKQKELESVANPIVQQASQTVPPEDELSGEGGGRNSYADRGDY